VPVGIRKIWPIAWSKVLAALAMFTIWHISIPTEVQLLYMHAYSLSVACLVCSVVVVFCVYV